MNTCPTPDPIMEPEDEVRRLRTALERIVYQLAESKPIDYKRDCWEALKIARAALNPAKSAAPFSPG